MRYFLTAVLCLTALLGTAEAGRLTDAKAQGLVCELKTGFLAPQGQTSPEILLLVQEKNAKRSAAYAKIAKDQGGGITAAEIGIAAAEVIRSNGSSGMLFEDVTGVCKPLP